MRWGGRKHHPTQSQIPQQQEQEQEREECKNKSKSRGFSFSPLSWLSKLTAKHSAAAKPKPAPAAKNTSGLPKRASPSPVITPEARSPSPDGGSPAAADVVPRRLSVGNDTAEADAARRICRRRHYSMGGDRDLPPLGHLIPFSRAASPSPPPQPAALATDSEARPRRHRRRRARPAAAGGRRSFSGRMPARVRVRSPRRAAATVSELERFAVVRRTRDPQREFRQSMVEMIASKGIARPEELERLLACYLSLNADEHHDCIIKVFRQVWFDINPARAGVRPGGDLIAVPV